MIIYAKLAKARTWMMDVRNKTDVPHAPDGSVRMVGRDSGDLTLAVRTSNETAWSLVTLDSDEAQELLDGLQAVLATEEASE